MLKDMLLLSRRKLNNWSGSSQIPVKHLIFGSKSKSCGQVWSLSSQEVILQKLCQFRLNNSEVLTRHGWNVCKSRLKQRKFYNAANLTSWKITCQICKRNLKSAKNCWKIILKGRESCSLDSILSPILLSWKSCLKVLILQPSRKTLKPSSMLSPKFSSEKVTRKVATRGPLSPSCKNLVVLKKFSSPLQLNVKEILNHGWAT